MGATILFDIGGTNMRVGISGNGEKIDKIKTVPTPRDFDDGMKLIKEVIGEISSGMKIDKACGGIAGMFSRDRKSLYYSPNLLGWVGKPLIEEIGHACGGAPVTIENDAALAGLAEAVLGAGKGYKLVMYMTISTGVGGARIVDGKIDHKTFGFEPGQQIIDISHGACTDCVVAENRIDNMGHLEDYISGRSIEKRFGKKAEELSTNDKLGNELDSWLAAGLYNSILHWSPEVIVLGGGLILSKSPITVEKVEMKLRKMLNFFPDIPFIKKAALGDENGLHGALLLSQSN